MMSRKILKDRFSNCSTWPSGPHGAPFVGARRMEICPNSYEMCLPIGKQRIKLAERPLYVQVKERRIASRSSREEMQEQDDNLEGQMYGAGIAD
ncbi:hypothetical protein TNCT_369621 [Trichonephila clavata]|uniref:Uncharacterized protein n=1 Tax=Trichonephila clavata TaxID=2740835 RepID=A0A8X6KIN6_TRICU|nr:hypothetical protein TNCT_369621 [Trichonephila clavata]